MGQLSSAQIKEYIPYLQLHGLLSYDATKRRYKTTMNGMKVLELYKKINDLIPSHKIKDIN